MPGIHLVCSRNSPISSQQYSYALSTILYDHDYQKRILFSNDYLSLGFTKHTNYPIDFFENEQLLIIVEGKVYGSDYSKVIDELKIIYRSYQDSGDTQLFKNWSMNSDGEYICVIFDKLTNKLLIFNDPLGRLPLYKFQENDNLFITREINFLREYGVIKSFDKESLYFHLLLGYVPGSNTIYTDIERIPSSSLIQINLNTNKIDKKQLSVFNFEEKNSESSPKKAAENLTDLFLDACNKQSDRDNLNILSLSGGLDSRAVAAGFKRNQIDFKTTSFLDARLGAQNDVNIAKQIASQIGVGWELINLDHPSGKDITNYLKIKNGFISTTQADDFYYHEAIKAKYGHSITHFSGDGGDKLLPDLVPAKKLQNISQLANLIIARNQIYATQIISIILGISFERIKNRLIDILEQYPEKTYNQKYVHFMIYERAMKWLFEGEDRNRYSFWSATPFYSLPFFVTAMQTNDEHKRHYKLYRQFLINLSEPVANITDENKGRAITSKGYDRKVKLTHFLTKFPTLLTYIKSNLNKPPLYKHNSIKIKCLAKQLSHSKSISNYFDTSVLNNLITSSKLNKSNIDLLFDLTSSIELLHENQTQLDNFKEQLF